MFKAVFFDLYNTLVQFWPPVDEIQQAACRELGLGVEKVDLRRGYVMADEYFNRANVEKPLVLHTSTEQSQFFAAYEQIILREAGLDVTVELASQVWGMASLVHKDLVLFDDVIPALAGLKRRGMTIGVISNLRTDMDDLTGMRQLGSYLDFCVTSKEVGAEKPASPIFLEALERAGVDPVEALHVGDQYLSDIEGAKAVGITPVLLDREGWHQNVENCYKVRSLLDLEQILGAAGEAPALF
jgi:putative hydrolase of the HAD superfamily